MDTLIGMHYFIGSPTPKLHQIICIRMKEFKEVREDGENGKRWRSRKKKQIQ